MSFTAMAWASKQKVKSSSQKLVLLMLANYADDQDKCWPSKQKLADMCCMSKSGICKTIIQLESDGFLVIEKRDGTSSIIRLNTGVSSVDRGCPPSGQGVSTEWTGGVHPVDTNLSMNQSEETIIETSISADAEFAEFWAVYPKRPNNPKAPAIAKYVNARQKLGVSRERLLEAARNYAVTMVGMDPRFIAQTQTWLNQRRWECDYVEPARAEEHAVIDDATLDAVIAKYPGQPSNRLDAKIALAKELAKGVKLENIVEAAHKFQLHEKQMRYDERPILVPILETWIRFRWRDMDAYEFCRRGMGNKLSVRPKRGGQS